MSDPMNLSGINEFGLSHMVGSLPIAHAFTITCDPFGKVNPKICTSNPAFLGNSKGPAGCNLKFSLIIACRNGNRMISDS
ncbi:hypothetical protein LINPERHAP2_LOCUS31343 [Linum perenne]